MAKESRQRKSDRKKPTMTLKERRTKKLQKKQHRDIHHIDGFLTEE